MGRFARLGLVAVMIVGTVAFEGAVSSAEGTGSELVEELLAHEVGANAQLRLESVDAFSPEGGEAVVEPGTADEETISYDYVDAETNRLIGLERPDPADHPAGAFVEALGGPTPAPSPSATESAGGSGQAEEPAPDADQPGDSDSGSASEGPSTDPTAEADAEGVIPEPCDVRPEACSVIDDPCTQGTLCRAAKDIADQVVDDVVAQLAALLDDCTSTAECPVLTEELERLLSTVCQKPVGRAIDATGDPGGACLELVRGVLADVMDLACGSTDAVQCAEEVLGDVDAIAGMVCGLIPVDGSGAVPADFPGAGACASRALGAVEVAITAVCGSATTTSCESNVRTRLATASRSFQDAVSMVLDGLVLSSACVPSSTTDGGCKLFTLQYGNVLVLNDGICELVVVQVDVDVPAWAGGVETSWNTNSECRVTNVSQWSSSGDSSSSTTSDEFNRNLLQSVPVSRSTAAAAAAPSHCGTETFASTRTNFVHTSQTLQDVINIDVAKLQTVTQRWWNPYFGTNLVDGQPTDPCLYDRGKASTSVRWNHPKKVVPGAFSDECTNVSPCPEAFTNWKGEFHTDFAHCNRSSETQQMILWTRMVSYQDGTKEAFFTQKASCEGLHHATKVWGDQNHKFPDE